MSVARCVSLALLGFALAFTGCRPVGDDAFAGKKHPAEVKGLKSFDSGIETQVTFVNKSGKPVKVYWLDYDGDRKLYKELEDGDEYDQMTYLGHPWLITDAEDNAWDVYMPDSRPRTVKIVAPKKNPKD